MSFLECDECGGIPGVTWCCRDKPPANPDKEAADYMRGVCAELATMMGMPGAIPEELPLVVEGLLADLKDALNDLEAAKKGCTITQFSSRMCQKGTKGCGINHKVNHGIALQAAAEAVEKSATVWEGFAYQDAKLCVDEYNTRLEELANFTHAQQGEAPEWAKVQYKKEEE